MMDIYALPTPCYLVDEDLLVQNLELLKQIQDKTDCKILLAQKGFSMYNLYKTIGKYLKGTTASSLFEARLGYEEMGGEVHIFAPAYREQDFAQIVEICDHIVFNSFSQFKKFKPFLNGKQCGMRVNPEYSEIETELYNPCAKNSRMGVTLENYDCELAKSIDGLHFHTMCEQNSDTLKRTLNVFDEKFGKLMRGKKWLNLGGGHHITRPDYDVELLMECITFVRDKYNVAVYLEPGEAIALNTGFFITEVLDIVQNTMSTAILDSSAACHLPDVLEMPYRPNIIGADKPGVLKYTYRLGAHTCLAGDYFGDYSFDQPLKPHDRLVFCDMAHYTMVKNNTFNGINLPSIAVHSRLNGTRVLKNFGYHDFKSRL